jgi:hypothetical protein
VPLLPLWVFVLATILSYSEVNATLASARAPRCGLLFIKLGMVCGDILSMLDTNLSKSLNVLTFVTTSNMPIHPSIFFVIRLTASSSVNVRSHLMLRFRHLLMKSVIDSPFLGLVLARSAMFILSDTMTKRTLNEYVISSHVLMLLFSSE